MKKKILLLALCLLVLNTAAVIACGPPRFTYRVLVKKAPIIIGLQMNQLDPEQKNSSIPIHQVLKGKLASQFIDVKVLPWPLHRLQGKSAYAIIFLQEHEEFGLRPIWARNNVILFKTMDEADFAIKRLKSISAILQNNNTPEQEQLEIEWLIENLKLREEPPTKRSFAFHHANQWHTDALWELSTWPYTKDDHARMSKPWKYGTLDYMTDTQKEAIFSIFRNTPLPSRRFISLVRHLGIDHIDDQLLTALYQALTQENLKLIMTYLDQLITLELSTANQEYLSKLIIYYYKAIVLPKLVLENHARYITGRGKHVNYVADYIHSDLIKETTQEWSAYLATLSSHTKANTSLLKQLIDESVTHLNMCNDPRISALTGKRKLWTCAEESAFAQAQAFDEEGFELLVFPNPSNGNFNIQLTLEENTPVVVDVLSIDGKSIAKQQLTKAEGFQHHFQGKFELEGLAKGIYFLQIRQRNQVHIQKIVVE